MGVKKFSYLGEIILGLRGSADRWMDKPRDRRACQTSDLDFKECLPYNEMPIKIFYNLLIAFKKKLNNECPYSQKQI